MIFIMHLFLSPRMASCQPFSQAPCQVSSCGSWSFQGGVSGEVKAELNATCLFHPLPTSVHRQNQPLQT